MWLKLVREKIHKDYMGIEKISDKILHNFMIKIGFLYDFLVKILWIKCFKNNFW